MTDLYHRLCKLPLHIIPEMSLLSHRATLGLKIDYFIRCWLNSPLRRSLLQAYLVFSARYRRSVYGYQRVHPYYWRNVSLNFLVPSPPNFRTSGLDWLNFDMANFSIDSEP